MPAHCANSVQIEASWILQSSYSFSVISHKSYQNHCMSIIHSQKCPSICQCEPTVLLLFAHIYLPILPSVTHCVPFFLLHKCPSIPRCTPTVDMLTKNVRLLNNSNPLWISFLFPVMFLIAVGIFSDHSLPLYLGPRFNDGLRLLVVLVFLLRRRRRRRAGLWRVLVVVVVVVGVSGDVCGGGSRNAVRCVVVVLHVLFVLLSFPVFFLLFRFLAIAAQYLDKFWKNKEYLFIEVRFIFLIFSAYRAL